MNNSIKKLQEENDNLRKQLSNYQADSILSRHYVALSKQMEDINKTLMESDVIRLDSLTENDEKTFERVIKLFERSKLMCETLVYLEERINVDMIREAKENFGSDYEEILNNI